jgi:membrane protein implicated in regulation of membrane protease activity
MLAQGMFFFELGLAFLVLALLPEGTMRTVAATTFLVGALVSAGMQYKLLRTEKRERREGSTGMP